MHANWILQYYTNHPQCIVTDLPNIVARATAEAEVEELLLQHFSHSRNVRSMQRTAVQIQFGHHMHKPPSASHCTQFFVWIQLAKEMSTKWNMTPWEKKQNRCKRANELDEVSCKFCNNYNTAGNVSLVVSMTILLLVTLLIADIWVLIIVMIYLQIRSIVSGSFTSR